MSNTFYSFNFFKKISCIDYTFDPILSDKIEFLSFYLMVPSICWDDSGQFLSILNWCGLASSLSGMRVEKIFHRLCIKNFNTDTYNNQIFPLLLRWININKNTKIKIIREKEKKENKGGRKGDILKTFNHSILIFKARNIHTEKLKLVLLLI